MADIADLGYKVDSSGLVEGTKALDQNAAAADKAGGAAERLEREYQALTRTAQKMGVQLDGSMPADDGRYARIAREAVQYAEAMRGANLSERAVAEAAREAAAGIDVRAAAMARAGTEQERMAARAKLLQEAEARAQNQQLEAARAAQAQEVNLKKLLGQIDPTVAALNRLADMEERLEKAADLGLLKPQVFQQYQAQLDATRQKVLSAGKGSDEFTGALGRLNVQSAETQRNLSQLITYGVTGNWQMAGSQMMQLGNQAGLAGSLFSGAGLAVGGFTAVVAAGLVAWKQGNDELYDLQRALILTGNYAGVSASQLQDMARQLGTIPGATTNSASRALEAVAASGRFTGEQLELVAEAAEQMRIATGKSVDETVREFVRIADEPVKAAASLNQTLHFLTVGQYESIKAFDEQGDAASATTLLMKAYADSIDQRAPKLVENVNWIGRAWAAVGKEMAEVWDIWRNIGRGDSVGQQIQALQQQIAYTRDAVAGGMSSKTQADIDRMQAQLLALKQSQLTVQWAGIDSPADTAAMDRKEAASKQWDRRLAMYDKAKKAEQEIASIRKDGLAAGQSEVAIEATIAAYKQHQAEIDARKGKKQNSDDNSANSFVASIQRQIEANNQLAESGDKVTASDRLVIQARQLLADKTNTMTSATRGLLQALIPQLEASDKAATAEKQRQRDMTASIALTERLTQLEKLRAQQANADLMGIGRGSNATELLNRQLDIQRQYLQEKEKLDKAQRNKETALSTAEYQAEELALQASLGRSLEIERSYQQRRMAMLGDWRTGFTRAWEDYVFAAGNASDQAAGLLSNGLTQAEDAFVKFVQTGKLSFSDLANSIIADLARIAAKQAITGLFGSALSGWLGGASASGMSTIGAQSFGNNTDWLTGALSFGGGRASGGPVSGSSFYEVGEYGRPELFQQGGKSYLIPGNSGTVVPAAPAATAQSSAAGGVTLNVTVQGAPAGTTATARQNANGDIDLQVLVGQLENQIAGNLASGASPLNTAVESRYQMSARV